MAIKTSALNVVNETKAILQSLYFMVTLRLLFIIFIFFNVDEFIFSGLGLVAGRESSDYSQARDM